MSMAEIITLSSSPPPFFARSPTPIALSSSPYATCGTANSQHATTSVHFRPAQATGEGLSSATTSRQALGPKLRAENVPVTTFISPMTTCSVHDPSPQPSKKVTRPVTTQTSRLGACQVADTKPQGTIIQILPSDVRRTKKVRNNTSLDLQKAVARRKDWTPPKPRTLDSSTKSATGSGLNLQESFGHASPAASFMVAGSTAKRRKIDSETAGNVRSPAMPAGPTLSARSAHKRRSKSPTKKALTITGLTTSHFLDDEPEQSSTLMMQFLASTQARMQSDGASDVFETSVKSTKLKKKLKSRLRSPRTSIKTMEEQDFVFASASQLARDESPTLLRDTAEAIRQSEQGSFVTEISTQQSISISTAPISPEAGIARYRGMKNLWCAAHRDENDALLYLNDPFDSLEVRAALAGKDALVESAVQVEAPTDQADDSLALLASLNKGLNTVCDIDDLVTPFSMTSKSAVPTSANRMYSTSSRSPSKTAINSPPLPSPNQPEVEDEVEVLTSKIPRKPNYASWTDEQLKDQVKEYGFKRLRARKSMIDKLDEYWAQKYGLDIAVVKAATKAACKKSVDQDHGHFLSKVHELAPRPQPKSRKPRSKETNRVPFVGVSKARSKSKLIKAQDDRVSDQRDILDIDEIDNTTALERLANIEPFPDESLSQNTLEPSTAPAKGTGVKATAQPKKKKRKAKADQRVVTPPPTIPEDPILDSSPGFATQKPSKSRPADSMPTPQDADTSLKSYIKPALLQPLPALVNQHRNHQKNPTWHEKILLYDPIVLEDFTTWLNIEGFNAIGVDDEIDAKEVKLWCEENGICCLWKGGWRGNKVKE